MRKVIATHGITRKFNVLSDTQVIFTVNEGVDVRLSLYEHETDFENRRGIWLATREGYRGWTPFYSGLFDPLQARAITDNNKSLYQKTELSKPSWKMPRVTEYYKFNAVFVNRTSHGWIEDREFFDFFEPDGNNTHDDIIAFSGSNILLPIERGHLVTVYLRIIPEWTGSVIPPKYN